MKVLLSWLREFAPDIDGDPVAGREVAVTAGRLEWAFSDGQWREEIVDETKSQAQTTGTVLAVIAVVAVVLIFLLGKRRGKKTGGARVEIYRL